MKVRLYQLDGKIPNLALMRISAHHRAMGDEVELKIAGNVDALQDTLYENKPDKVYASALWGDLYASIRRS